MARDVDVILMRQDPPFDMSYITACHVLELISDETLVLNDPVYVRGSPEKTLSSSRFTAMAGRVCSV